MCIRDRYIHVHSTSSSIYMQLPTFVGFSPLLPYRWRNERLGSELISGCKQKRGNLWLWVIMPTCCCVPGCSTRGGLSFPKDQRLRKLWIVAIKRNSDESRFKHWCPQAHGVVCHKHFRDEDFISVTTQGKLLIIYTELFVICLLYTSPSPRDLSTSRMPSSA